MIYHQTRPPELKIVDDEKDDDWTFSINVQYHHAYPDLKGYRRTSNGVTPGDMENWEVSVRVGRAGNAKLHIDFPPALSLWTSEADGIWACPAHHVVGFEVDAYLTDSHAMFAHQGGLARSITVFVPCTRPGTYLDLHFTCPTKEEGDHVNVIFRRNVMWDSAPTRTSAVQGEPIINGFRTVFGPEETVMNNVNPFRWITRCCENDGQTMFKIERGQKIDDTEIHALRF